MTQVQSGRAEQTKTVALPGERSQVRPDLWKESDGLVHKQAGSRLIGLIEREVRVLTAFRFSSSSALPNSVMTSALSRVLVGLVWIGTPFRYAPLPLLAV